MATRICILMGFIIVCFACNNQAEHTSSQDSSATSSVAPAWPDMTAFERKPLPFSPEAGVEFIGDQSLAELIMARDSLLYELSAQGFDTIPADSVSLPSARGHRMAEIRRQLGVYADRIARVESSRPCPGSAGMQPIEFYDGTFGVSRKAVATCCNAVGLLQWNFSFAGHQVTDPGNVQGAKWGTGCLIAADLLLTAGHCFDREANGWRLPSQAGEVISSNEIATLMSVKFNYQIDRRTNQLRADSMIFPVVELVEYRREGLDYAIVRLGRNKAGKLPGQIFKPVKICRLAPSVRDPVFIIQHPQGNPKMVAAGPVNSLFDGMLAYFSIDTYDGSSGSPVISEKQGGLVGIHVKGGCDPRLRGANRASAIVALMPASSVLARLAR